MRGDINRERERGRYRNREREREIQIEPEKESFMYVAYIGAHAELRKKGGEKKMRGSKYLSEGVSEIETNLI